MATLNMTNLDRMFKNEQLSRPVQDHLKRVYSLLSMSLLVAAAGAFIHLYTDLMQGGLLASFGAMAFLMLIHATPHSEENTNKRLGFLAGFAFLSGLGLGSVLELAIMIDPSIIPTAFLGTSVIFVCFTLSAFLNKDKNFLFLAGFLSAGCFVIFGLAIANAFIGSQLLFRVELYICFIVMSLFVLYDTQLIIVKSTNGDTDAIGHCLQLFVDFISMFRSLLMILAGRSKDKKKNN